MQQTTEYYLKRAVGGRGFAPVVSDPIEALIWVKAFQQCDDFRFAVYEHFAAVAPGRRDSTVTRTLTEQAIIANALRRRAARCEGRGGQPFPFA